MERKMLQRIICLILSVTLLLGAMLVPSFAAEVDTSVSTGKNQDPKPDSTAPSLEEMKDLVGVTSYAKYISEYKELYKPSEYENDEIIEIKGIDFVENDDTPGDTMKVSDSEVCLDAMKNSPDSWKSFLTDGVTAENTVYLAATSKVGEKTYAGETTWNFSISEEQVGYYHIYIEYYNCLNADSSVSAIQKKIKIDDKVPFDEVGRINFDKNWAYNNVKTGKVTDYNGILKPGSYVSYDTSEEGAKTYTKTVTKIFDDADGKRKQQITTYTMSQDINGNSMTPEIVETSAWSTYICSDSSGYTDGYFEFFLSYGDHSITLEAEREPVIIKSIKLVPANGESTGAIKSYAEYLKEHSSAKKVSGSVIRLEAEFPDFVSDASVVSSNSNDSAANYPISSKAQLFNVIGETSYSSVGQWAAYKFSVNKTGMYRIGMRYKQDALQGMFICRSVKLWSSDGMYGLPDGSPSVPFAEAQNVRFDYDKEWKSESIGGTVNGKATDFSFYFEEGVEYTIYFECSLGALRDYIQRAEASLTKLNACYLRIIQRTGSSPDENQSYDFYTEMQDVLVTLLEEAKELTLIADQLEAMCGTNGSHLATLDTIARILDKMGSNNGEEIAANLGTFKSYLGTLGTWITDSKNGKLVVDTINIIPAAESDEEVLPKAKAGFFKSLWFEITSFIYSFFTDYDQMGLTVVPDENTSTIDVWLAMGRDQSQIWRTMIDAKGGFTDTTQNAVALKLVAGGTLLPSILAKKGPDVYMGLASVDVINYAIRDAVMCVSGNDKDHMSAEDNKVFSSYLYKDANGNVKYYTEEQLKNTDVSKLTLVSQDFKSFTSEDNFAPAAMDTLTLNKKTYGIPMTMSFAMMFYRMDVLAELNEEVPETWDELLALLPQLQVHNMTLGVSYVSALDFMMYQRGGNMWKYTDDPEYAGAAIDLDSDIALEAFDFVCRLYTDYSLPVTFDAANRFRTGEMPIVIGDYASIYNTLVIYATEIEGLWEFCSLPGSYNEMQGRYNYNSLAGISATVIPNGCDNYEAAWSFVQWQTGDKVQAEYGNKIVALIGPAAKYETANLKAIHNLSWTAKEKAAIDDQMNNLSSIVNYPGSYIISRYMKFAFLDAYNDGANAVEAMQSYIGAINKEITRKREEFEMKTQEDYLEKHGRNLSGSISLPSTDM